MALWTVIYDGRLSVREAVEWCASGVTLRGDPRAFSRVPSDHPRT